MITRSLTAAAALLLLAGSPAPAQRLRTVEGTVLDSSELPAVRLTIDPVFSYAGGQAFELYGVAEAEQHLFVDADEDGRVRRLWWIQFEGYLPGNAHTYDYEEDPLRREIGGHEWYVRPLVTRINHAEADPPSDGDRAEALLNAKGYRLPDEVAGVRFVRLLGEDRRNELMLIYMEDLSTRGTPLAELDQEGRAGLEAEVIEKAIAGVTIEDHQD
jgi:hypothetical protein